MEILDYARQIKQLTEKELFKSALIVGIGSIMATGLTMIFLIIVARLLTVEDYGYTRFALSMGAIGAFVIKSGFPTALTRYLGKARGDKNLQDSYFSNTFVVIILLLIASLLILYILNKLDLGILLIIIGITVSTTYLAIITGVILPKKIAIFSIGHSSVKIAFVILLFIVIGDLKSIEVLAVYCIAPLIMLSILELFKPTKVHFKRKSLSGDVMKELSIFSLPVILGAIGGTILTSIDIILIESFLGLREVGIYSVAKTLTVVFMFVPQAFTIILMPKVAGLKKMEDVVRYFKPTILLTAAVSIGLVAGFYFFGDLAIKIVFGEKYLEAANVLLIVSVGMVFSSISWILGGVWVGIGKPIINATAINVAAVVNVIGNLILIPKFGIVGSAISLVIANFISLVILSILTFLIFKKGSKKSII